MSAVVAMYGYYGPTDSEDDAPSSPLAYLHAEAPPFLIIHGTLDTLVLVEDARHFADELASASNQPVVYAELPGTQHNFDLFHSLRFHAVTDAVESFLTYVSHADVTTLCLHIALRPGRRLFPPTRADGPMHRQRLEHVLAHALRRSVRGRGRARGLAAGAAVVPVPAS